MFCHNILSFIMILVEVKHHPITRQEKFESKQDNHHLYWPHTPVNKVPIEKIFVVLWRKSGNVVKYIQEIKKLSMNISTDV